jgi:hypothetical protein
MQSLVPLFEKKNIVIHHSSRLILLNTSGGVCRQSRVKSELSGDTLDTVESVKVLVHNDLVASTTTLAGSNDGESKEELPDAVPASSVLGLNLLLVAEPVTVPSPESSRVVNYRDS